MTTTFLKVKSHSRIEGNELADQLANEAAEGSWSYDNDIGSMPYSDLTWPSMEIPGNDKEGPSLHYVNNLNVALKQQAATGLSDGHANSTIYTKAWADTCGRLSTPASNHMWADTHVTDAEIRTALRFRYGRAVKCRLLNCKNAHILFGTQQGRGLPPLPSR